MWRWARHRPRGFTSDGGSDPSPGTSAVGEDTLFDGLWDALSSLTVPVLLVRGMRPDSVLGDEDEEELRRRLPSARVAHVAEAGHSVQGDAPLELAALIEQFVFGTSRD